MPKKKITNTDETTAEETTVETIDDYTVEEVSPEVTEETQTDKTLKTVTIKIRPQYDTEGNPSLALPVTLIEPFLGKTVELVPTGEVTQMFADQLMANYDYYEIVADGEPINIKDYKIRASYRLEEMSEMFKKLSLADREKVIEFTKKLDAADNIGEG